MTQINRINTSEITEELRSFAAAEGIQIKDGEIEAATRTILATSGTMDWELLKRSLNHYIQYGGDSFKFQRYRLAAGDVLKWVNAYSRNQQPAVNKYIPSTPGERYPSKEERDNQQKVSYLIRYYLYFLSDPNSMYAGFACHSTIDWMRLQPFWDTFFDPDDIRVVKDEIMRQRTAQRISAANNNKNVLAQTVGGNMRTMQHTPHMHEQDVQAAAETVSHYRIMQSAGTNPRDVFEKHGIKVVKNLYPFVKLDGGPDEAYEKLWKQIMP